MKTLVANSLSGWLFAGDPWLGCGDQSISVLMACHIRSQEKSNAGAKVPWSNLWPRHAEAYPRSKSNRSENVWQWKSSLNSRGYPIIPILNLCTQSYIIREQLWTFMSWMFLKTFYFVILNKYTCQVIQVHTRLLVDLIAGLSSKSNTTCPICMHFLGL